MGKCMSLESAHDFFFHVFHVPVTPSPLPFSLPCTFSQESGLINKKQIACKIIVKVCVISIYIN